MRPKSKTLIYWLLLFAVLALAFLLRFYHLENRPAHHDEGVNGWFIENLYEKGEYHYSPEHYHGPTFFYLGSFAARYLGLNLFTIRLLAAIFGFLLCLTPLILSSELKKSGVLVAVALLAVSPSMVFFSRYAIHEILLVCFFTAGACFLFLYVFQGEIAYLVTAAFFLASAAATKETVIVYLAGLGAGLGGTLLEPGGNAWEAIRTRLSWKRILLLLGLFAAGLFIWFRPKEVVDFLQSYLFYLKLGTKNTGHEKPWHYFFELLWQSERFILLGGIAGALVALWKRKRFALFCTGWAFTAFLAHALIAYKTPWIVVNLVVALCLLTGTLVATVAEEIRKPAWRAILVAVFLVGSLITFDKAYRFSFREFSDPPNRYAYVHSFPSVTTLERRVKDLVTLHPEIKVAITSDEVWPFPFLFRKMPQIVWYNGQVPDDFKPAEIVIARDSQNSRLIGKVAQTHRREDYAMRPGVNLQVFIVENLASLPKTL